MKKSLILIRIVLLHILFFDCTHIAAAQSVQIQICSDKESIGKICARKIANCIVANNAQKKPTALGLATGSTPIPTYNEFKEIVPKENIDLSHVTTFNLDEYVGLPPNHKQSYHHFMWTHLFNALVQPQNIYIPNGYAKDEEDLAISEIFGLDKAFPKRFIESSSSKLNDEEERWVLEHRAESYEELIKKHGPIDMQILGIGTNGHIGFAEPGSPFDGKTMITKLTEQTRADNARFFDGKVEDVPSHAITMGIGTILRAKQIMLLATGKNKAAIMAKILEGEFSPTIPAMALRSHPNVFYCLDEEAASELKNNH